MKKIILILALFLSASWAQNLEINPDTGLIIDPDSPFTNMHASRKAWLAAIRWMQDSEGLWEIEPEDEEKILNYLEKYYGEKYDTRRRIPLAIFLQNKIH
ncbi:cytochrome C [Campylobacter jejuni]|nr:cytochrome C [Campylobacter jejuni]